MLRLLLKQENEQKILRRTDLFCILVRPNTGMLVARGETSRSLFFFFWDKSSSLEQTLRPNEEVVYHLKLKIEFRTIDEKQMQKVESPQF